VKAASKRPVLLARIVVLTDGVQLHDHFKALSKEAHEECTERIADEWKKKGWRRIGNKIVPWSGVLSIVEPTD
jgi:hypothetical protein